jgi:hypothetical protein
MFQRGPLAHIGFLISSVVAPGDLSLFGLPDSHHD